MWSLKRTTSESSERVSSAPLLLVQDELGVTAGVEHADEAPGAAYIVLLDL
jgi:hypothetical protein